MDDRYSSIVAQMRGGAADAAITETMKKVVEAVYRTGKAGSVTLKLNIAKLKDGDTELEIQPKISAAIPQVDLPKGIYYPDERGNLHRTDPRQLSMLEAREGGKTVIDNDDGKISSFSRFNRAAD